MSDSPGAYGEWLEKGSHDIEVAQFLYDRHHYTDVIAVHIQQALEKYLKGFLLKHGWALRKTHDLITLASRAGDFGLNLRDYEDALDRINEYYIESRYPLGAPAEYPRAAASRGGGALQDFARGIKGEAGLGDPEDPDQGRVRRHADRAQRGSRR